MHMKKGLAALFAAMTLTAAPLSVWADVSHDLDGNGALDKSDCTLLCDYLLTNRQDIASQQADWDGDYALTAKDLTLMKRELLNPKQDPQNPQDPNPQDPQTHVSGSEYMAQVRSNYATEVPQDILNAKGGEL